MTPEGLILINAISTVGLVIITAFYVYLTHRLLNQTEIFDKKQLNLATLPYLECKLKKESNQNEFKFSLLNYGNHPAYDVDIFIIGIYFEDDCDLEHFKSKYLRVGFDIDTEFTSDSDGMYGVYDRMVFPIIPAKTQMNEKVKFPIETSQADVFIQYRNSLNTNYSHFFWFIDSGKQEFGRGNIRTDRDFTEPTPRIELGPQGLISEKNEKIPEFFTNFLNLFSHSVPQGSLKESTTIGCEGRGEFVNL